MQQMQEKGVKIIKDFPEKIQLKGNSYKARK